MDQALAVGRPGALPRVAPFAAYMLFVGTEELIRWLSGSTWLEVSDAVLLFLYPLRIALTTALLWQFRHLYTEVRFEDLRRRGELALAGLTGAVVYFLWLQFDAFQVLAPPGYNPTGIDNRALQTALIGLRLGGAVLVVPLMEEIFWRSFLARYLLHADFQSVAIGRFTLWSFLFSALLFSLEHHLLLAGFVAGVCYNLLLLRTRSIALCILAHALTNLLLGIHVLAYGAWHYW